MGGGMATNIQKAGYPLVVYDVREGAARPFLEAGARLGNSPADVASRCDVTLTSLPGPSEVESVSIGPEGVLAGSKAGSVYIDLSTSRPTLIREIEPKFRAQQSAPFALFLEAHRTGDVHVTERRLHSQ